MHGEVADRIRRVARNRLLHEILGGPALVNHPVTLGPLHLPIIARQAPDAAGHEQDGDNQIQDGGRW